jgi:hypothetical protein
VFTDSEINAFAGEIRNSCMILVGKSEGKSLVGRPRRTSKHNYLKLFSQKFDVYYIQLHKKIVLGVCENTVIKIQVP